MCKECVKRLWLAWKTREWLRIPVLKPFKNHAMYEGSDQDVGRAVRGDAPAHPWRLANLLQHPLDLLRNASAVHTRFRYLIDAHLFLARHPGAVLLNKA